MNHFISLISAVAMTTRHRLHRESILEPTQRQKNVLPVSETFDRDAIERLLAQPGATALRFYYGMDELLRVHAVLVAADAQGNDILPAPNQGVAASTEPEDDFIVERGQRCPDICHTGSPLNP